MSSLVFPNLPMSSQAFTKLPYFPNLSMSSQIFPSIPKSSLAFPNLPYFSNLPMSFQIFTSLSKSSLAFPIVHLATSRALWNTYAVSKSSSSASVYAFYDSDYSFSLARSLTQIFPSLPKSSLDFPNLPYFPTSQIFPCHPKSIVF